MTQKGALPHNITLEKDKKSTPVFQRSDVSINVTGQQKEPVLEIDVTSLYPK